MPYYPQRVEYRWTPADSGLLATSLAPAEVMDVATMSTAGRLELVRIKLPYPASITNIHMRVTTAGNTLTSGQCFAAMFTAAGVKIGVTADQAASWVSTGHKTMALVSGPFAVNAGEYYVGMWYNGTTGPSWARGGAAGSSFAGNVNRADPNYLCCTSNTGLTTTCPDPFTTQAVAAGSMWWVGLS